MDTARADVAEQEAATLRVMSDYVPDLAVGARYKRTSRADIDFSPPEPAEGAEPIPGLSDLFSSFAFDVPRNNYAVEATLRLPLSEYVWQIVPALRAARSNEAASRYRQEAQAVRVALTARLTYYGWLKALAQIGVAKQAVAGARARLADARLGLAAGTLAQVDVLRLESLLGASQLALSRADSQRQIAERDLALLIGVKGPYEVGEDLFQKLQGTAKPVEQLIEHGRQQRPDALALRKSMDATRDAAIRSWTDYFPRLEAVGTVNYANPNPVFTPPTSEWNLNWFVALNLQWSVSRFMRGHAEVKRMEAAERGFRARLEQLRRAIAREVLANWHRWKQAASALSVTEKQLQAADAAHEQMEKRYAAGLSTTTDVIDAENARNQAALDEIDARIELRVANARLLSGAGYARLAQHSSAPARGEGPAQANGSTQRKGPAQQQGSAQGKGLAQ